MKKDTYKTLQSAGTGEFKDRGSKFLGYAFPVAHEADCQEHVEALRKAHPKARHYCYAYRLGLDGNHFRANDDGEPGGTAGRPILGQIDSFELTNVLVVVVRYFGGTLLGTSGLINAYKLAAAEALQQSEKIEKTVAEVYRLTFDYALMSQVMNALKKTELEMVQQDFGATAAVDIAIRQSETLETLRLLKARIADLPIEMVDDEMVIEGLTLTWQHTR